MLLNHISFNVQRSKKLSIRLSACVSFALKQLPFHFLPSQYRGTSDPARPPAFICVTLRPCDFVKDNVSDCV